jgi:hypothetical protein
MRPVALPALWEEMHLGDIYECSLRDPKKKHQLFGLQHGTKVWVDPRLSIIEILLHELIHRHKPTMSERAVTLRARHLALSMNEAQKSKWHRAYQSIKIKRRPKDLA